ncbi:OmpA family protein [Pantoea sp. GL120224-02]|uniref:OmpA family protein n=1 Tax=Pantoea sp. GL120224-02 TaxID=1378084 RepID=UPI000BCBAC6E|nr:OmpA family protein [Pantoea sp. GL120224-02]SNY63074.1 Outer membrane protein OmpA [Pantoea sp. GL120224-02]
MVRPDSRQGLTLLAAVLAILLVVGFSGLKPLNTVALCVLVLLVAGFLLWHLQRNATDHQPDIDASLPPETYCGPVILVIGDTAPLFGDLTHRETRLGWYLNVRKPGELPALAERLAQQYSALLPQLSVMLAIIPGQHTSADILTQQQSGWLRAYSQCRVVLKGLPPLWAVIWGSSVDERTHWFSYTPEQLQFHPENDARLSLAEWITRDPLHFHHALRLQSLMQWYAGQFAASRTASPCQIGVCLTPVPSLSGNLWQQHTVGLTTLSPENYASPPSLPLPDVLLSGMPQRQGISRSLRTARRVGMMLGLFLALAMLASFIHNQRLVRSVADHLALWHSLPEGAVAAKTLARDVLIHDRTQLDAWQRSGEPLRYGVGLYQGLRLIAPANAAIHRWAPPPAPAPVIQQVVEGPQTVLLDSLSLFESGKAALRAGSDKVLINALVGIKARPGWLIVVAGHTDSTGNPRLNQALSLQRAGAVRDWMRDTGDVPESCFAVQGYGQDRPVATNESAEGRALNRRVEISLVPQADACRVPDAHTRSSQDDGHSQSEKE